MKKTKRPIKFKEIYFTSSITSEREKFEVLESSINFNPREFANDCLDQMKYLSLEIHELSKLTYLPISRLHSILRCNGKKVNDEEIKILKRKLYLT